MRRRRDRDAKTDEVGLPEKFDAFYKAEVTKWAQVIETTGMPRQ